MLMQAYDFLVLNQKYDCVLEMGGDDQWSNMLAGCDLIRRKTGKDVYAATCSLLLKSDGKKMGKTASGALWLDEKKTSPYDFYQYFRNVEDVKVAECMKLLTFMPLEEIEEITKFKDERINKAKERLAYEVTKLVHGKEKADEAERAVKAAFSNNAQDMPSVQMEKTDFLPDVMVLAGVAKSKSEARTLIAGGGVIINDVKADGLMLSKHVVDSGEFILHKGKKVHVRIIFK